MNITTKQGNLTITFADHPHPLNPWPDSITINGVPASNTAFGKTHSFSWRATAAGNLIYYMTDCGDVYSIPKKTFIDAVRNNDKKTKAKLQAIIDAVK